MNIEEYKLKISNLNVNEQKMRDLYLRNISLGNIQGPITGYPSIDKPWLKYYNEDAIIRDIPNISAYRRLHNVADELKDNLAIYYLGTKISYDELINKIDTIANGFANLGIKKGDVVSIALPNTPENACCIYALNKIGAIANIIDLRIKGEELREKIGDVNSKLFIGSSVFLENIKEANITSVDKIIISNPTDSLPSIVSYLYVKKNKVQMPTTDKYMWFNGFYSFAKKCEKVEEVEFVKNNPVAILYTSGTTGKSKGVVLTNENLNTFPTEYQSHAIFELNKQDKFLNQVPPFLAYNLSMATHLPLSLGMQVYMLPDYQPENFAKNIIKFKINHVVAGPADCYNFLDNPIVDSNRLDFLKTVASGSDKINEEQKAKIEAKLASRGSSSKIIEGYGMTEVSSGATTNLSSVDIENSVGVPLPKMTLAIFEPDTDKELPYGTEGEICITGPTMMLEYYDNEEATNQIKRVHSDGKIWVHTGDAGKMDENGFIYFMGRYKRIIVKHDGFKVFPVEIERVLNKHNMISNSCVVGIPDKEHNRGEMVVANIVLKGDATTEDQEEIIKELQVLCDSEIKDDAYKPKRYIFKEELPLTSAGKVDYRLLAKQNEDEINEDLEEVEGVIKK